MTLHPCQLQKSFETGGLCVIVFAEKRTLEQTREECHMKFGGFVKDKRQSLNITLRALAERLEIAPSYMSDIEKGKRNAPTQEVLEKMASVLELNNDDRNKLFDLAAESKNEVAQDLTQYLSENKSVRVALRRAKELNLGEDEWLKIIDEMLTKGK